MAGLQCYGSCVARNDAAILLLGASGSGKSDLALQLIDRGFVLVADDRVRLANGDAFPPPPLAGLIEVRGLGLLRMPFRAPVRVRLVLRLDLPPVRLPPPADCHPDLGVPLLPFDPRSASAACRAELALDCAIGRRVLCPGFTGDGHATSGSSSPGAPPLDPAKGEPLEPNH